MKQITVILIICCMLFIPGCSFRPSDKQTAENVAALRAENRNLKSKLDDYNAVYDKSLKNSIKKYCSEYLSYDGKLDISNVKKIKRYITPSLYSTLLNQPFNEGNLKQQNYLQQTCPKNIYYENISERLKHYSPVNETTVLAVCYQSVVTDNSTKNYSIICKFVMKFRDNQWLISAVEILK